MEDITIDTGFDEFAAAFDDDYQIGDEGGAEEPEAIEEDTAADSGEAEEPVATEAEEGTELGEGGSDDSGAGDGADKPETFVLRVNKEERTVNREEVISLAQKGADYDRVKGQLAESRTTNQELQSRLDKYQNVMDALEMISADSGQSVDQLVEQMQLNMLMKGGKSEAEARAEMRALKAESALNAAKAKETAQKPAAEDGAARAEREVAEFHKRFPGVELTEELCKELMPDVQNGTSISDAYRKREDAKKDAQIAELKRQLEAEKQNKKNRSNSPGSQNDSGGRRNTSDFDKFEQALFA